jgi:hypothetical protein
MAWNSDIFNFTYLLITSTSKALFYLKGWDWVHLIPRPLFGLLYQRQLIMIVEQSVEWKLAGETEVLGEKSPPLPLCPPQIPGSNPGRRRGKQTINRLSYSIVFAESLLRANLEFKQTYNLCRKSVIA